MRTTTTSVKRSVKIAHTPVLTESRASICLSVSELCCGDVQPSQIAFSGVSLALPSEGKGHTFESCRARQCLFVLQDDVPPARLDRSCEILIRAGVIAPEISGLAAQNTRDRRTRACLPSASASASRSPPERASAFGLLTGAGICGQPLEPFR
jgi:hypothetical protein